MSVVQTMVTVINTVLTLKVAITVAVMMDMYWLIMDLIVTVSICSTTCLIFSLLIDIDECVDNNGGCHQLCNDTDGSYECDCYEGYQLLPDDVTCEGMYHKSKNLKKKKVM